MENIIIVGNSTTAEVIYAFITKYKLFNVIGFAVNRRYHTSDTHLGLPNLKVEELSPSVAKLFVALQWNRLNADRRDVFLELKQKGFKFVNLISPTAIVNGNICGSNCWIADNVVLDFYSKIEENTFIKMNSVIGPRASIASHCFIGVNSVVGGAAKIGCQTFVGLSSTIFDEVVIGKKCLLGATSIIKRNIPDFTKVTSNVLNTVKSYDSETIEIKLLAKKNVR